MDRYGEAIEYDLHERLGLDLLDFFRRRHSWRKLASILDRLPRDSHFRKAISDDEEWAEKALADEERNADRVAPAPSIPLTEYTREVELLTLTVELLQAVNSNIRAAAHDPHPPAVRPMPRPRTALDAAREAARESRIDALIAEVEQAQVRWSQEQQEEDD